MRGRLYLSMYMETINKHKNNVIAVSNRCWCIVKCDTLRSLLLTHVRPGGQEGVQLLDGVAGVGQGHGALERLAIHAHVIAREGRDHVSPPRPSQLTHIHICWGRCLVRSPEGGPEQLAGDVSSLTTLLSWRWSLLTARGEAKEASRGGCAALRYNLERKYVMLDSL